VLSSREGYKGPFRENCTGDPAMKKGREESLNTLGKRRKTNEKKKGGPVRVGFNW
jgi:hypothetical protein